MKSFISSIDELEVKVNIICQIYLMIYKRKTFSKDVVSDIEDIQKQCDEIDEIIDERIKVSYSNIIY